jgi:hypothetical protein
LHFCLTSAVFASLAAVLVRSGVIGEAAEPPFITLSL